jgi:type IV pilus assembly protein PilC
LTQFIVSVSNFFVNDYWKLILWIVIIIIILKLVNTTYLWRMMIAKIYTKMPIFGYVVKQSNIVYFIKSFTILLDSWVLLLESLKTASKVVPNLAYKKELIRIKNEVEVWLTISRSLWLNMDYEASVYLNKLFPEEFAYVVSTWEETWSLSESLKKVWYNYNWELKRYIWNMSSMMEPVIIVIVWVLVGTIVIAIMLPFFEMWKIAKNL